MIGEYSYSCLRKPVRVNTDGIYKPAFAMVSAGRYHTCGLTKIGRAYCWGDDYAGKLGNGILAGDSPTPVAVETSGIGHPIFIQVTAGYLHSCGLTEAGIAYCWGDDYMAQLGNGDALGGSLVPVPVDASVLSGGETFSQLTAGYFSTCGVTSTGAAYCWGWDDHGRLGCHGIHAAAVWRQQAGCDLLY